MMLVQDRDNKASHTRNLKIKYLFGHRFDLILGRSYSNIRCINWMNCWKAYSEIGQSAAKLKVYFKKVQRLPE